MTKSNRALPEKTNRLKIILIVIIILAAIGLIIKVVYDHKKPPLPESWTVPQIESPNSNRPPEVTNQATNPPSPSASVSTDTEVKPSITPCQKTAEDIKSFYSHLTEQDYIKAYELNEPVGDHINKIVIKLLNNPPVVATETSDFFTLLKNTAHFYRILGPKDLSFMKDILNYENDDMEDIMAMFYSWSTFKHCQSDINLQLPLDKLYEHASFFLNTLGGQSYLFRRDSRIRILTKYYCVLIADRAAKRKKNKYEIDIKGIANSVIKDMQETDVLDNQEQYIKKLQLISNTPSLK